jgi:uncharacterized protein
LSVGNNPYLLLPFRFKRLPDKRVLLVNEVGEHIFLQSEAFKKLVSNDIKTGSGIFLNLKGKHFLTDTAITPVINLLSTKYRTKKAFLRTFTALHMVVITVRCNHRCNYCHASSQAADKRSWDMNRDTALNVVRIIMETPSSIVKIEFQGGEPLLNFEILKTIVQEAKRINRRKGKDLSFVVCTNLTLLDKSMLAYLKKEGIMVSTSLDGPKEIHDRHRIMRNGGSSYDNFVHNLRYCRSVLGHENVSALMTTTKDSIPNLQAIIDEYVKHNFQGIFLRSLNPYGYARTDKNRNVLEYRIEEFVNAYKKTLLYMINLNQKGIRIVENYATLLLSRILTPFSTGFVDLQSPTGAGINGAVYDFNGDVYPSDESRMLAHMGDRRFWMGNVNRDSYLSIFKSHVLQELIKASCVETLPGCHSCALQIYCGADPVLNYATQKDLTGHRPTSDFCAKNKELIEFLLELIEQNQADVMDVFWSWITNRSLAAVRGKNQ